MNDDQAALLLLVGVAALIGYVRITLLIRKREREAEIEEEECVEKEIHLIHGDLQAHVFYRYRSKKASGLAIEARAKARFSQWALTCGTPITGEHYRSLHAALLEPQDSYQPLEVLVKEIVAPEPVIEEKPTKAEEVNRLIAADALELKAIGDNMQAIRQQMPELWTEPYKLGTRPLGEHLEKKWQETRIGQILHSD